jgi:glycosyltransferase involved in cell wall biosynthesis
MTPPTFSIIAPIYNEIQNLPELHHRLREVMEPLGESWELILVDDGSSDGSTELIHQIARQDQHIRPVIFARNFGHEIAVAAGLDFSRGKAVIMMDADLQDPPELIPELIARWREGNEVVYAVRTEREGESWFKLFTASLFYRLIARITDVDIPMDVGNFRLLDRQVVNVLKSMHERHRFMRGMSVWVGFRQVGVPYRRAARFAITAITGFSYLPLQLATYLGFISAGISIVAIPIVVAFRLAGSQAFFGQATTLIAVLFLGGVQLISLGILGEYIGRLYDEAKGRPLYIVREPPAEVENPLKENL